MYQLESIELALETAKSLGLLFDDIGSQRNQDTELYRAFKSTKEIILNDRKNYALVKLQLESLFALIATLVWRFLLAAQGIGLVQLDSLSKLFNLSKPLDPSLDAGIHDSIMLVLRQQVTAVFTAIQTGERDDELLFGGDDFWGVLSPIPVTKTIKDWTATVAGLMISIGLEGLLDEELWMYQAVAIIDNTTTRTCLNVHGQTQLVGVPFELEGQPRYGDRILKPPFHDYCRTSRALIHAEDATSKETDVLVSQAKEEIIDRKK